jgi:uncharacterized phage-associated protein
MSLASWRKAATEQSKNEVFMSYDGRAVANFVLDECDAAGVAVTHLALQKIVYFCHVWSLIELGQPLVRQSFEAWEHGPVLQYLYREFKEFGPNPLRDRARQLNPRNGQREVVAYDFAKPTRELLIKVVAIYSRFSASILRELSHAPGGPWDRVWHHRGNINPGMRIDNRDIAQFYSRMSWPVTVQ